MPTATKVQLVVRFFDDLEQFGMTVHAFDIGMDIQGPEAAREAFLRIRSEPRLVTEEDHMMVEKGAVNFVKLRICQIVCEADA